MSVTQTEIYGNLENKCEFSTESSAARRFQVARKTQGSKRQQHIHVLMPQHPAGYQHCSVRGHMAQSYPGTFSRVAVAMV